MAEKRIHRARHRVLSKSQQNEIAADLAVIRGKFVDYLRALNYSPFTIEHYSRRMVHVACWLSKRQSKASLHELTRSMVPRLLAQFLPHQPLATRINYRKVIFHWLRFKGRFTLPVLRPWASWLSDYRRFLQTHQGVSQSTLDHNEANAKAFLEWQFGARQANWSEVKPEDIWRFARHHIRGVKPLTGKSRLGCVRGFLNFVHLRGACGSQLAAAIPKLAAYGPRPRIEILCEKQRRKLLSSFKRSSPEGIRNYAMILCMMELGLRSGEVIGLRLQDIHWKARRLSIQLTKTGRGRQLPLPDRVFQALQDYIKNARPQMSSFDHVFLRHPRRSGFPLSRSALKGIVHRAYRHCGFPASWTGAHRLRHTFASRLHKQGVDMKPIADLLGHRKLDSTNIYTQVDIEALRPLAQPWPLKP